MSSLNAKDDGTLVMPCGCSTECINGKYINILCEEHEHELDSLNTPAYTKKTKMRDYYE